VSLPYVRIPTAKATDADRWLRDLNSEAEAFCTALGRFVLAWADVEQCVSELIRHYARVPEPVARALFSGSRARTMLAQIAAIGENTRMAASRREDISFLTTKISALNTNRDRVVHFGSLRSHSLQGPSLRRKVSNEHRSSRPAKHFVDFVGSEELDFFAGECLRICEALERHMKPGRFQRYYWPERLSAKSLAAKAPQRKPRSPARRPNAASQETPSK